MPVAQVSEKTGLLILPIQKGIVTLGMQGKKDYQEKLFAHFQLSDRIPETNFYRRLKEELDLGFLYPLTKGFYGESGQKSIDPVVFFKLCLVGSLENIISDHKLHPAHHHGMLTLMGPFVSIIKRYQYHPKK